jgi:hypothetical protein
MVGPTCNRSGGRTAPAVEMVTSALADHPDPYSQVSKSYLAILRLTTIRNREGSGLTDQVLANTTGTYEFY